MDSDEILMVKKQDNFLSIFYSNGKHSIIKDDISKYKIKVENKYKNPIEINKCYLYPTKNIKEIDCIWVNIKKFVEDDPYYNYLLTKFDLYLTIKKMYIKQM